MTNGDNFAAFPGELGDGCFIQALVYALGKARCSYFVDSKLNYLASAISLYTLHGPIIIILQLGVY